jgi:hypothetical protein
MPYTVRATAPAGQLAEKHTDYRRAFERAAILMGRGSANVTVEVDGGKVYQADRLAHFLEDARTSEANG